MEKCKDRETVLFEAIAKDVPEKLNPLEVDEHIHRYHKQSQKLYSSMNARSLSNESLPLWLKVIDEDERGITVWQPATRLPHEEQSANQELHEAG